MRTANPILGSSAFSSGSVHVVGDAMSIQGTVNKTAVLLTLTLLSAGFTWSIAPTNPAMAKSMMGIGAFAGFIMAVATSFKPTWASITAPIYAIFEGLFLGGISIFINAIYPGIAPMAVVLTFGTLACMLFLYKSGIIRATEKFKLGIISATSAIFFVYLLSMVLGIFGINLPLFNAGLFGIGFSLFVVAIAALNLVLDFDFIERNANYGAPKHMEWYAAFGLMVTLIWLYIEILRLLAIFAGRED